jgi:hypothetical protein
VPKRRHRSKTDASPVNGIWSLALYIEEHLFSSNRLNRDLFGKKNKSMHVGADGSLTIYVQSQSPSGDKEANRLPALKARRLLALHAYRLAQGRDLSGDVDIIRDTQRKPNDRRFRWPSH